MKNRLLTILFVLLSLSVFGQNVTPTGNSNQLIINRGGQRNDSVQILPFNYANSWTWTDSCRRIWFDNASKNVYYHDCTNRLQILSVKDSNYIKTLIGGGIAFNGNRPITANVAGFTGVNPGTTTNTTDFLNAVFYPSQTPTSGLTITYNSTTSSAIQLEKSSGSTISVTLNWSAGRQASTLTLSTVNVNSINQSFSQPSAPGTANGITTASVTVNTNTTLSNVVTTTDSKTSTSNASVSWFGKWYYGFVGSGNTSPSDADIIGLSGQAFNASRTQPNTSITTSTASRGVIAFDASLDPGNVSKIFVGGLDATANFTRTVRSFTNASGYTTNYIIYVQNTITSAGYTFNIQ